MVTLQDVIHHLEVGAGLRQVNRSVRFLCCAVGLLLLVITYDLRAFRNMSTQEAMDTAQLARNLSQGKGYSTSFIRPISIFLIQNRRQQTEESGTAGRSADPGMLKGNHPDLANPPVYPVLLAGLMKVLPFQYAIPSKPKPFWSPEGNFYRYQPDFLLAIFNQLLFFGLVLWTFFLARRLFDEQVAWLSALLLMGTELFWRFSVSGLSTIFLVLIFMGLVSCLARLEEETREPKWSRWGIFLLTGLAGALVGLGSLTRYSFGWLLLPVLAFVILYTGKQRALLAATTVLAFCVILTPWLVRNYSLSGMPFGTATYAILENSAFFPDDRLERSLSPDLLKSIHTSFPFLTAAAHIFCQKLVVNSRTMLQSDLPKLGGTWVSGFFLVGLLVRFRNPKLSRLRIFLLAALVTLAVTQALGRTKLSEDSSEVNSENLLVILGPLVIIYGVSLFFVVLDQVEFPFPQLRKIAVVTFGVVASLPLILTLLPPGISPVAYPPYYPPSIQTAVGWTKEDELMMSDIPWAVAWYGQSQCVGLTLNARADFFAINDFLKPISALYLTPHTVDRWTQSGDWGNLFLQTMRVLPGDSSKYPLAANLSLPLRDGTGIPFPLTYLQAGWPNQLLFTFRQHWPKSP